MSPRGEEGAPSAPILAISLTSLNGWATVLGTSIAEPAAAEKGRRSLAWLSRGLPGRRALLPSELPDGHQRGEGGHRLPRPRAMAPSSRQNCLWPARQRAGHAGEAGAGGKGNAERKAKGLFGARAALEGARPECPLGHRRPPGATELGTAWLQEVWGHLLLGHGHPVCPSSGTSWWAILGPAAFPPLAITLPQRRLGCPPPGSLLGLRWGRDLPGLEQPPFSGLEESWCDPGGASSGGGCQGNAGGRRKWALTAPPPQSWGRQGLSLSWTPIPPLLPS